MTETPPTRVDQVNQLVRAACLMLLVSAFVFVFVWGALKATPIIGSDAFLGVLSTAMVWYFKSRDEQNAKQAAAPTPPIPTVLP